MHARSNNACPVIVASCVSCPYPSQVLSLASPCSTVLYLTMGLDRCGVLHVFQLGHPSPSVPSATHVCCPNSHPKSCLTSHQSWLADGAHGYFLRADGGASSIGESRSQPPFVCRVEYEPPPPPISYPPSPDLTVLLPTLLTRLVWHPGGMSKLGSSLPPRGRDKPFASFLAAQCDPPHPIWLPSLLLAPPPPPLVSWFPL